jgi:iron complex outermembrane recepter protein
MERRRESSLCIQAVEAGLPVRPLGAPTAGKRRSLIVTYLTASAIAAVLPGTSWAQSTIEEVVVTARKREESLQNVPVAVTSLSGNQLQREGIRSTQDLGRFAPNLRSQARGTGASIITFAIRGQKSSDSIPTVDQAVGLYSDGVYMARPQGLNGAFFDLSRIEVVKGPQGTLYGRNTTGGAINIISRDADYRGVHGFVGADVGNHTLIAPRFAVNVPLVEDKLTLRVGAQGTWRKGFGRSEVTGQDIGYDRNQRIVRATIVADPWESVNVKLKSEYFRTKEHGNLMTPLFLLSNSRAITAAAFQLGLPSPSSAASQAIAASAIRAQLSNSKDDYDRNFNESPQHEDFEGYNFGGTVTVDLTDRVQLKSITGYRRFTTSTMRDLDATSFRIIQGDVGRYADGPEVVGAPGLPATANQYDAGPAQRNRFFSQEFNLSGDAFGGRLKWLGGLYYSQEIAAYTEHPQLFPPLLLVNGLPASQIADGPKIFNGSWSLYSQEEFSITDKLTIQGGMRYTEERKYLNSQSRNYIPSNNTITCSTGVLGTFSANNPGACFTHNEKNFTGVSWMAGASYKATDDVLIYGRIAKGFRGGVFQLRTPTLAPANPETATETEVGAKTDWWGGRVRLNVAAYRTKWANKQESIIITTSTGGTAAVIQNAATAKLHGFEVELTANPVGGLSVRANVGYQKGHYTSFPGALPAYGGPAIDASGEKFSDPPWQYTLGARYEHEVGPGLLGVQADWSWIDGANLPPRLVNPNIPAAIVNRLVGSCTALCSSSRASLGLLSASADYRLEDRGLTFTLFSTNLLNKKYQLGASDPTSLGGVLTAITGEPRMFGLSVKKIFGQE